MTDPCFFGYGSLVNRATHDYADPTPAKVFGWRRVWAHTNLRDAAFLSVEPAENHEIEGLIAGVPLGDWTALDIRERAYERTNLHPTQISHARGPQTDIQIYSVATAHRITDGQNHPILLSYLDCVVKGFLDTFGEDGVTRFFESTSGWQSGILDDRDEPIYPRAVTLSRDERTLVDDMLSSL